MVWPMSPSRLEAASIDQLPTVFIVDDDEGVRDSLRILLEADHRNARAFASGAELLASIDGTARGCLILDYHMPDMTGLDLLDRMRRSGVTLPAILVTGLPEAAILERAAKIGVVAVLQKPFDDDILLGLVDTAVRHT
jgi:two-component system response regulator FixJ